MNKPSNLLIIYDDRDEVSPDLQEIVGNRHFGDILIKRSHLSDNIRKFIPSWSQENFLHLKGNIEIQTIYDLLVSKKFSSILLISARASFPDPKGLTSLIERLPFAYENFVDRDYNPLIIYFHDVEKLLKLWSDFSTLPLVHSNNMWRDFQKLEVDKPNDLNEIETFLQVASGSTETRHFNYVDIDKWYYTKKSNDKHKMEAEYRFYHSVPERMRPWFVETFDFCSKDTYASYRMMRYYLADMSLQWIHNVFTTTTFKNFIDQLMFFIEERDQLIEKKDKINLIAEEIFVKKVNSRIDFFLNSAHGRHINEMLKTSNECLNINSLRERYLTLYRQHEKYFITKYLVIGHGDPCFSNILYNGKHRLLKLIDPKGGMSKEELWSHPFYDLCKISHSILGDYDFINNGLYRIALDHKNNFTLTFNQNMHNHHKSIFISLLKQNKYDPRIIRLGEASLFLSMLPLHIDHPNKVMAFILNANKILTEIENGFK